MQNADLPPDSFWSVITRFWLPNGVVEFKTDNKGLFEFSLEEVGGSRMEAAGSHL